MTSLHVQHHREKPVTEARLVLVARVSHDEYVLPMDVAGRDARTELSARALKALGAGNFDLYIEAEEAGGLATRRRVAVDRSRSFVRNPRVPTRRLSWYATSRGNLSLKVAGVAGGPGPRPTILHATFDAGQFQLELDLAGVIGEELALVVRGEQTGRTVELPIGQTSPIALAGADLERLGAQPSDVFIARDAADAGVLRIRVAARDGAFAAMPVGSFWRWVANVDGAVVLRHVPPTEVIAACGVFDEQFYRAQVPDLGEFDDAIQHYVSVGAAAGLDPSSMFDTKYYLQANPAVRGMNPLHHYCEFGWKELRNPSPSFDTWWYWAKHLDLADESVMPLAHFERVGKGLGLSTAPPRYPSRHLGAGHQWGVGQRVRRVCLFAAYDVDGIVDDYVVDYVRELSRYADVYYWSDCEMADSELAKLAPFTVAAWAEPHGEYDFGSYKRLADRVGWSNLEMYDELLLVNDSCYLLRPLDDVFAQMDARACDWWGLQATDGTAAHRGKAEALFRDPIPMDTVRTTMVDMFEQDTHYDFHIGSYFLAYRSPVIDDPEFRRYLASVTSQYNKRNVVRKYEIGFTRWLISHGHTFDTYVPKLYPFHPLFSRWYFELLEAGFPLLKRYLLNVNHYHVPRLLDWKERVLHAAPAADVECFERNLERVTAPEQLQVTLNIGTEAGVDDAAVPEDLLTPAEFVVADRRAPKHASWWAFPVCAYTENFSGNERAIFEKVKNDPAIRKVVLTRSKHIAVDGVNVEVVPLDSPEGQHLLMRSGVIFIKHSVAQNLGYPISAALHNIIQVWHGVPFKRIAYASEDFKHRLESAAVEQAQYSAVVASSATDALAMAASFYPLTVDQIWNTGLPRNDFIVMSEDELPLDFAEEIARLRRSLDGRRLALFMPTFRNDQANTYYRFTEADLSRLEAWLTANNCVLGLREHMADSARAYSAQLVDLPTLDLSDEQITHPEVLYRLADLLITDYHMPQLSGLELCQKLKQSANTSGIPAIMLTARGYHLEPTDTEKNGILRMLSKPFSPRHLLATVNEVLEQVAA